MMYAHGPTERQTTTDRIDAAIKFINTTSSHIFLTGKAGTGKTTFLKNLAQSTHKSFVVVAPTGIAALNAGGVTIHSQFLLPRGTFLPERYLPPDFENTGSYFSTDMLGRKHPLNSERKQVLRSIDLLVIDEVSMLRADVLDAIDYRLKAARGNFYQAFGGVQVLFIGDLYQLPPVVKGEEAHVLGRYYASPWFYEARALHHAPFVYIELDKIFRQQDNSFIHILNNLRHNVISESDIEELNRHFQPEEAIKNIKEIITLTTHNYKADELNRKALLELKAPSHYYTATLEGDFPESMYPVLPQLELKEGAQIMFIKNDTEGNAYVNGKLATVKSLSDDQITVSMAETHETYTLKKETWENKKYTINANTRELDDEVVGTFVQYPIKLAWAITVHKSQGLTFDKAIIDVDQAFADGQVYVALSRLRSLNGLVLRTKINPRVIGTNPTIVAFSEQHNNPQKLLPELKARQQDFAFEMLTKTFDFETLVKEIRFLKKGQADDPSNALSVKPLLTQLEQSLEAEKETTGKFKRQLDNLLQQNDRITLLERIRKGSTYYKNLLYKNLNDLLHHIAETKQRKRVKTYLSSLNDLDQSLSKKIEEVDKAALLTQAILEGKDPEGLSALAEKRAAIRNEMLREVDKKIPPAVAKPRKKKSTRVKKDDRSTYDITLEYFNAGLTLPQIAHERGLAIGTIESHLAKAVETGRIQITRFMPEDRIEEIMKAIEDLPDPFSSKELYEKLMGKFSYGELRATMAHAGKKAIRKTEDL
ncbi:MAG: helix-turn-helix domain-containing protein [Cyclobacteriaceae bacterium]|nr:helix-turn-helix domain-containing protein [Cyclobacteriaceae bacterium]UYN86035.1 MAG: helix-turn-helix domain-containing protein [Cyclobacteriaceae bacterium]